MTNLFDQGPPTEWEIFVPENPTVYLARWLYQKRSRVAAGQPVAPVTVVCISDSHNTRPDLPDGDVLLHAGDLTEAGTFDELQAQLDWLNSLPHRFKVVVSGNHDLVLDTACRGRGHHLSDQPGQQKSDLRWGQVIYLEDGATTLRFPERGRTLKIYGSPWTRRHGNWAFQYLPTDNVWTDALPDDIDVLLTHGPPKGHLDLNGQGSEHLLAELWRVRPRLTVFGHIHAGHGVEHLAYDRVQAYHDGLWTTQKGPIWLVPLALAVLVQRIAAVIRFVSQRGPPGPRATWVNAAVVAGFKNERTRPINVVDI